MAIVPPSDRPFSAAEQALVGAAIPLGDDPHREIPFGVGGFYNPRALSSSRILA